MAKGDLFVGGVKMPPLKALTITHEKVWSSNTGRAADGTMIGDLICLKYKLQAEFVPITDAEAIAIEGAVSPAFFSVQFWDPATNSMQTRTMYAGTPSYPVMSYVNGIKTYSGVTVDFIEQ